VGDTSFDVAGVGDWISNHVWLFLLIAFVAFVFYIFQKGGFAEKFLEYRLKREQLAAQQASDVKAIAEAMSRRNEGDEPLLPFERKRGGKGK